jgi:hypothetical protein
MPKLLALFILIAGLGPGDLPEYEPAGNSAYTADLRAAGYRNGYMDPARMMSVGGCLLERDAAYTYSLLMEAARRDGVRLDWEDCYRSYGQQKSAYNRRCPITDVPVYRNSGPGGVTQTGTRRVRLCSGPPTAPAGYSNHGWGRAVDFTDGRGILSCYDHAYYWLRQHAHSFGWVHPYWARCGGPNAEPWHWEYAGVTDPTLVAYITTVVVDPTQIEAAE